MNLKNKNEPSNKPLQTILYNLLQVLYLMLAETTGCNEVM
jgi:hypothetical protein